MTADDDLVLAAQLLLREARHEAGHALAAWLVGGRVRGLGRGKCLYRVPSPILTTIVDLAGPAADERALAGLVPADMLRAPWQRNLASIEAAIAPHKAAGGLDDVSRAEKTIASLTPDPDEQAILYRGALAVSRQMVADPGAWHVLEIVAAALLDAGQLYESDFTRLVGPYPAVLVFWQFAAPWRALEAFRREAYPTTTSPGNGP